MGMKQILVMMAVMAVMVLKAQSVVADEKLIADPIVEWEIRKKLLKPEGELTEADLEKVTSLQLPYGYKITDLSLKEVAKLQKLTDLSLDNTKITDAGLNELAKLQKLEMLYLRDTQVTEAGVAELKKALPKCEITHSYKKD